MTNAANRMAHIEPVQIDQRGFITNRNLNRIIQRKAIQLKAYNIDDLYTSDLRFLLSTKELDLLAYSKQVLLCEIESVNPYNRLTATPSTQNAVFKDDRAAFHLDKDCDLLHSDMLNITIPNEIKSARKEKQFCDYALRHKSLFLTDQEEFLLAIQNEFNLSDVPKVYQASNSGASHFEVENLPKLQAQIDELIKAAHIYKNSDNEIHKAIRLKGYGTDRAPEAREPDSALYKWHHTYKQPVKSMLYRYFRIACNPNLSFKESLLTQLGFKACSACSKQMKYNRSRTRQYNYSV